MKMKNNKNKGEYMEQLPTKWEASKAPKECKECGFVETEGYSVMIHPDVLAAAFSLCKEITVEWQMLLSGTVKEQVVYVTGYYIPKQEVSYSTVKNLEAIDKKFIEEHDIVATIHSHANMEVFFSATDDEYTNMSWIKHHVVINNNHKFVAKSRYDLPCGGVKFVESVVNTMIPSTEKVEGIGNIEKYEYKEPKDNWGNSGFHTGARGTYDKAYDYGDYAEQAYGTWENSVWQPMKKMVEYVPSSFEKTRNYEKINGVFRCVEVTT